MGKIKNFFGKLLGKSRKSYPNVYHYRIDWNKHSSFFCNGGHEAMVIQHWYGDRPLTDEITGKQVVEQFTIHRYNQLMEEDELVIWVNKGERMPIECVSDPLAEFDLTKEKLIVAFERRSLK